MIKRLATSVVHYVRDRMWTQLQYVETEYLRKRHGMRGVAAYLQTCWNAQITKEVLIRYGANIHPDAWPVGPSITLHEVKDDFANLTVGPGAYIGRESFLDLSAPIIIEGSASVGMRCMLVTHRNVGVQFPDKPMAKLLPEVNQPIILRRGCSLGAGVIVLSGVEVGEDSVIGAGVVVDRNVPPRTIVTSSRHKADFKIPDRYWERMTGRKVTPAVPAGATAAIAPAADGAPTDEADVS